MKFNLADGIKADRKLYVVAVQIAEDSFEIIGDGVTESTLNFNIESEDYTDILGGAGTTLKGMKPTQEFTPYTIKGGSKLAYILHDIIRRNALAELQKFDVLQIFGYLGAEGAYEADKQVGCTITPQSLGGDATVDFPITINFSNQVVVGTVNTISKLEEDKLEFTPKE